MEFKYIIVFICLLLLGFLIFKEIKRDDKSRLFWRLLANVFMVTCLALLIIPINYLVKKQEPVHVLNLLTEGTVLDTIKNIKERKYDLDSTLFSASKNLKIEHLADLEYHLAANPAVKKINIYGYGLHENELKNLKNYQLSFHPSNVPNGMISASWQKKLKASESLKVQGIYHNSTKQTVKLKLYGLGASLDSLSIKPNTQLNFSLVNTPKQVGRAVFNLFALQGNDTLSIAPVPFEVENKEPISVLMLASFPDFEYKFLKKWLYEKEYAVAVRTQISKNKYSTDFLNSKAVNLNQLNQALLKTIDLVIIDEDEFAAIAASDRAAIYSAVNNGMGLLIRVTNQKPKSNAQNFNQYEVVSALEKPLLLKSADQLKFSELAFKQTIFLKTVKNYQPVVVDETGKVIANVYLNGMGKVLTTSLASSYQWQLAGKSIDYGNFWSFLFDQSLRKKSVLQSLSTLPAFPSVNEKSRLVISAANQKAPVVSIDSIRLSVRQNMEIPFEWDSFYWPQNAGWHNVSINNKTESVYFYKKSDWKSAKNFAKRNITSNFINTHKVNDVKGDTIEYASVETISKLWFFIGFLVSISFLWYEQRFLLKK